MYLCIPLKQLFAKQMLDSPVEIGICSSNPLY